MLLLCFSQYSPPLSLKKSELVRMSLIESSAFGSFLHTTGGSIHSSRAEEETSIGLLFVQGM
jgi:hypothetical protein